MKLTVILTFVGLLNVCTKGLSQEIRFSGEQVPLESALNAVEKQAGYVFLYTENLLRHAKPITISVEKAPMVKFLNEIFKNQPLQFHIKGRSIFITLRSTAVPLPGESSNKDSSQPAAQIKIRVTDAGGRPLAGASVINKRTGKADVTDADGWLLLNAGMGDVLDISFVGYERTTYLIKEHTTAIVKMTLSENRLDDVQVIAYGTTTKRFNTGNVTTVKADEIEKQPVSNPIAALQGRVAGLMITANSGVPGAAFKVEIRGRSSILQGSAPLYIVDGVPVASNDEGISNLSNASGSWNGLSMINAINPADIASIEVLKDADATAIYGSRGANGVILITTKKGERNSTDYRFSVYNGWNRVSRGPEMLNLQQYLQMRREAFKNDGVEPTPLQAPDLLVWDTTKSTDFTKLLSGNPAHTTDVQLSANGGNDRTRFLVGAGYHRETSLSPGDQSNRRTSLHFNINHRSNNNRFNMMLSGNYSLGLNDLTARDMATLLPLPPNMKLINDDGSLVWGVGGVSYSSMGLTNPLAILNSTYDGRFQNLVGNLQLSYRVVKGLDLKLSAGYNTTIAREKNLHPSIATDPFNANELPYAYFASNDRNSWLVEPQASYQLATGKGTLNVLAGGSFQRNLAEGIQVNGRNYKNDALLNSIAGAGEITSSNSYQLYKYGAFFGRINYDHQHKYLVNLTGRRDGSSRFGPGRQFENFGAVGAAWIFSEESFIDEHLPFLSFGKLRGSYGITGNDQIGDYGFLDTWTPVTPPYQGIPVIQPNQLFNPLLVWESNKKLEAAIELGFLNDQLMLTAIWYQNRCGNQLVYYPLPLQTGFGRVLMNSGAVVENQGIELQLNGKLDITKELNWSAGFNISIPRNRLRAFPNLALTSYANTYVIGQPLSVKKLYRYEGIDDATGIYRFTDVDKNGSYGSADRIILQNTEPAFYGGLSNTFKYRKWSLDFFFEFRKRQGAYNYGTPPGYGATNFPVQVLDRWQEPGDNPRFQRYVAVTSSPAFQPGYTYIKSSESVYMDMSYLRLRNLSISYRIAAIERLAIKGLEVYARAQNIFVLSPYKDADPEIQNPYALPLVRTIVLGCNLQF